jgi:hypothetical protein
MASALVLWCWVLFFYFKGTPCWIWQKNVFPPLEPKLLVMWERINEALKRFFPTLPMIWVKWRQKVFFYKIQDGGPFLTERIVYFLSTVQCYNILEIYCCYEYKNIGRCVNLLLKKVCCWIKENPPPPPTHKGIRCCCFDTIWDL